MGVKDSLRRTSQSFQDRRLANLDCCVCEVTRSLFNYLVPMLQGKRAEEEETEEGRYWADYIG
jgi:hypothetical protein